MKYSDHPMSLVEGEYPWEREEYIENGVWKERWVQLEDKDIPPDPGPEDHGTYHIESFNEEYWGPETVCKECGTRFMAFKPVGKYHSEPMRNFCPGCGKRLEGGDSDGPVQD